jgi:hypothetical protein
MSPPDAELTAGHAGWLLAADPEAGLEAFLRMRPPLPAATVLPMLQVRGRGLGRVEVLHLGAPLRAPIFHATPETFAPLPPFTLPTPPPPPIK